MSVPGKALMFCRAQAQYDSTKLNSHLTSLHYRPDHSPKLYPLLKVWSRLVPTSLPSFYPSVLLFSFLFFYVSHCNSYILTNLYSSSHEGITARITAALLATSRTPLSRYRLHGTRGCPAAKRLDWHFTDFNLTQWSMPRQRRPERHESPTISDDELS